jgi:hypothetical protein
MFDVDVDVGADVAGKLPLSAPITPRFSAVDIGSTGSSVLILFVSARILYT